MIKAAYTKGGLPALWVHPRTIQKQGKIMTVRIIGGRRRIQESEIRRLQGERGLRIVLGYASFHNAEKRQIELLKQSGAHEIISDVGSGLNEERRDFLRLLNRILHNEVSKVIIAYEDRLTRLEFVTLKRVFEAHALCCALLAFQPPF